MARFYFHVHDTRGELRDEEGLDLRDLGAVRNTALSGARSLICGDVMEGRLDLTGELEVTDAAGALVLVMTFAEAAGVVVPQQR